MGRLTKLGLTRRVGETICVGEDVTLTVENVLEARARLRIQSSDKTIDLTKMYEVNEPFAICDDVTGKIQKITGRQIRLTIEAPVTMRIDRAEIRAIKDQRAVEEGGNHEQR